MPIVRTAKVPDVIKKRRVEETDGHERRHERLQAGSRE